MTWQHWRPWFLMIVTASTVFSWVWVLLNPAIGNRQLQRFQFPNTVPLKGWLLIQSYPLEKSRDLRQTASPDPSQPLSQTRPQRAKRQWDFLEADHHYQYGQFSSVLTIEMRYISGALGIVSTYFQGIQTITPKELDRWIVRQHPNGAYAVFTTPHSAYLTACINPRGGSTLYPQDFPNHHWRYDDPLERILKWMVGQEPLRDRRCLWALLSIPLSTPSDRRSPDRAYARLESAWIPWQEWWRQHFPAP